MVNSECWWSSDVKHGKQYGIVARHMGRRIRSQRKRAKLDDTHGSEWHGFAGRWFCLITRDCGHNGAL